MGLNKQLLIISFLMLAVDASFFDYLENHYHCGTGFLTKFASYSATTLAICEPKKISVCCAEHDLCYDCYCGDEEAMKGICEPGFDACVQKTYGMRSRCTLFFLPTHHWVIDWFGEKHRKSLVCNSTIKSSFECAFLNETNSGWTRKSERMTPPTLNIQHWYPHPPSIEPYVYSTNPYRKSIFESQSSKSSKSPKILTMKSENHPFSKNSYVYFMNSHQKSIFEPQLSSMDESSGSGLDY